MTWTSYILRKLLDITLVIVYIFSKIYYPIRLDIKPRWFLTHGVSGSLVGLRPPGAWSYKSFLNRQLRSFYMTLREIVKLMTVIFRRSFLIFYYRRYITLKSKVEIIHLLHPITATAKTTSLSFGIEKQEICIFFLLVYH